MKRRTWLLVLAIPGLAACGKAEAPPAPDTTVAAADVAPVDTAPPKPSERERASALLGAPLPADKDALGAAIALADQLTADKAPEAQLAAARVRLVVAARALEDATAKSALGADGIERQLRLVAALGAEPASELARCRAIARGLIALAGLPDAGAELATLRPLLTDPSPEGQALRLVALDALEAALDADATAGGFEAFARRAGPLLCDRCADAGALPPDRIDALADPDKLEALAALPATKAGANALVLAAVELEAKLRAADPGPAPLGDAIKATIAGRSARAGWPLPVVEALPPSMTLGPRGLTPEAPAITFVAVGPDGVRLGTRPLVSGAGALLDLPEPLARATIIPTAELAETSTALPDRARAVVGAAPQIAARQDLPGLAADAVELAVLPGAPPRSVAAAADALQAAGLTRLAVTRPGVIAGALPLHLRAAPAEVEAGLVKTFDKPIVIVVGAKAVDVWGPEKPKDGGAIVGPDAQADIPTATEPGWRGETLARLRIPIPPPPVDPAADPAAPPAPAPEPRLGATITSDVRAAIDFWMTKTKVGPVVHIVAGEGAPSWDVLALAQAIQEGPKKEGATPIEVARVWPGARCAGDAKDCASALVVAFSKIAVASERGLTNKPKKGDKPEPTEKPPEPSDEFCNKADIQTQMRKRAGSIRFCYEKELQLDKDLQGRLVARFTIDRAGKVKGVSASGDMKNKSVVDCVKNEISKIQFAAPDGGECVVSWPFQFRSN
ncbi:MAG: AgmX/PglI C-terminal domain-containing protein [Deltaproteobacteria bacterium]|nr:AgmX/PglI C-terminal domain-containing protein [Deltaproteobacteria bacterium]